MKKLAILTFLLTSAVVTNNASLDELAVRGEDMIVSARVSKVAGKLVQDWGGRFLKQDLSGYNKDPELKAFLEDLRYDPLIRAVLEDRMPGRLSNISDYIASGRTFYRVDESNPGIQGILSIIESCALGVGELDLGTYAHPSNIDAVISAANSMPNLVTLRLQDIRVWEQDRNAGRTADYVLAQLVKAINDKRLPSLKKIVFDEHLSQRNKELGLGEIDFNALRANLPGVEVEISNIYSTK